MFNKKVSMLLSFLLKTLMISFYNYFCCVLSSLDIVYNFCFPFLWFQSCDLLKISFRISVLWFWQFIKVCLGLFQRSPAPSGGGGFFLSLRFVGDWHTSTFVMDTFQIQNVVVIVVLQTNWGMWRSICHRQRAGVQKMKKKK